MFRSRTLWRCMPQRTDATALPVAYNSIFGSQKQPLISKSTLAKLVSHFVAALALTLERRAVAVCECPWRVVQACFCLIATRTTSNWLRLMPLADLDVRHTSELGADSAYSRLPGILGILPNLLSHGFNELLGNLLCSHIYVCVGIYIQTRPIILCWPMWAVACSRNSAAFWPNRIGSLVYRCTLKHTNVLFWRLSGTIG